MEFLWDSMQVDINSNLIIVGLIRVKLGENEASLFIFDNSRPTRFCKYCYHCISAIFLAGFHMYLKEGLRAFAQNNIMQK